MTINWHAIWQDLMDDHLPILCGKDVNRGNREFSRQIRLDYYVEVKPGRTKDKSAPLYFLKKYNVMEFKGPHEKLTVKQFRYYSARALIVEGMESKTSRVGKVALTIMTCKLPRVVIANPDFKLLEVRPWLYRSDWIPGLDIHLFVISKTKDAEISDGMAFLQVLEGNPRHQRKTWIHLMRQNLNNTAELNRIIIKIDKEVGMSLADEFRQEGEIKGEIKGLRRALLRFLTLIPVSLRNQYSELLLSAQSIEELDRLEAEILQLSSQSA